MVIFESNFGEHVGRFFLIRLLSTIIGRGADGFVLGKGFDNNYWIFYSFRFYVSE